MNQAKTPEEVIARLRELNDDEQDLSHKEADMLLCDALLFLGRSDVVEAYLEAVTRVRFHYA